MTKEPLISIIVPVYNTEKYLRRCVDSIIAQTFTDWECLLIDDGSTDESPNICDEYAIKDSRIKVFHKENGGIASVRQLGIEYALGIYSIQIDSDDWVECQMLEIMYCHAKKNNADIIVADYFVEENSRDRRVYNGNAEGKANAQDVCKEIISSRLMGALWNKFFRHELFSKIDLRFIDNINYCEDVLILVQLLQNPINIFFIHEAFYHYNKDNPKSITMNYNEKTFSMRLKYLYKLMEIVDNSYYRKDIQDAEYAIKMEALYHNTFPVTDFKKILPSSIRTILRSSNSWRNKIKYIYYSYFSYRII